MEGGGAIETQENDRVTGTLRVGNDWRMHSFPAKILNATRGIPTNQMRGNSWRAMHVWPFRCFAVYNKQLPKVLAITSKVTAITQWLTYHSFYIT